MNRYDYNTVYSLSPEEVRRHIACSQESMTLTDFMKPVSYLLGCTCTQKNVFSGIARDWLVQEGYLSSKEFISMDISMISPKGASVGLSEQLSKSGEYMVACCNRQGQQFLLDSLEQILAFGQKQWEAVADCLTPEFIDSIPCEKAPETPTSFLDRINSQLPSNLSKKFTAISVNSWLVKQGLMEETYRNGRWVRISTDAGEAVGLVSMRKVLENGKWKMKLPGDNTANEFGMYSIKEGSRWTQEGKRFILAHLKDIARDFGSGEAYQHVPLEFSMSDKLQERFSYDCSSLPFARFMDWLNNALQPATGIRLSGSLVLEWLTTEGFLAQTNRPGNSVMRMTMLAPTERGTAMGLKLENGSGYVFTAYPEAAQRYIVEHLEELIAFWQKL